VTLRRVHALGAARRSERRAELTRSWRILTLPQLRHVPRGAAFFDFIVDEVDSLRPILTG